MRKGYAALFALLIAFTAMPTFGQDLETGKWLWISHCSVCHGELGVPVLPLTPDISQGEGIEKSMSEKLRTVRNGSGVMPPFAGKLRDEFIVDIVSYMLTLYPKISPPLHPFDPNLM